jgi:hypothetical protein
MSLRNKVYDYVGRRKETREVFSVPEFGEDIYFSFIDSIEWEKVIKLSKDSVVANNVWVVILKAEDLDGNKIFSLEDKHVLEELDYRILCGIANRIREKTLGEIKKNSSETPSA